MESSLNRAPAMGARAAFPGRLAGAVQILFAVLLGGVSALAGDSSPDFIPRGVILAGAYSLPGIVGMLGVAQRRPALLLAASGASAVGSVLAFSGVTLIFLLPAVLFAYAAVRLASVASSTAGIRASGVIAGTVIAAALIALVMGAGASALLVTDERCWTTYATQGGTRIEAAPFTTGEVTVPAGALSYNCSTGVLSARGVGLAGMLGGTALALVVATRPRPSHGSVERGLPA